MCAERQLVGNELRELSTAAGGSGAANDLLSLGPAAISYRAMRGFGYTCQTPGPGLLRISRNAFFAYRDPQPGRDSALLYLSGMPTPADSGWITAGIIAVSSSSTCGGGVPAISLTLPAGHRYGTRWYAGTHLRANGARSIPI